MGPRSYRTKIIRKIPRKSKPGLFESSLITDKSKPSLLTSISPIINKKNSDRVFLVGGGASLKDFDFQKLANEDTICVNNAVFDVPNPNFFVTKDYLFLVNYLIPSLQTTEMAKNNWNSAVKIFVACLAGGELQDKGGTIVDVQKNIEYNLTSVNWIVKNAKQKGFSLSNVEDFRCGIDSGYGALQLAILLGYKQIYLLGYDMCIRNGTHYHNKYGPRAATFFQKKLNGYFNMYTYGLKDIVDIVDIEVFSCSPISRLNTSIPYRDLGILL